MLSLSHLTEFYFSSILSRMARYSRLRYKRISPSPFYQTIIYTMIRQFLPILLLTISNIFMTFAWYGHLKFKSTALWIVILVSWSIALLEYCFQVPANRIGHEFFSAAQLKTIQEVITLIVFSVFSVLYLKEEFRWNYLVGFCFIILAVFFIFKKW